MARCEFCGQEWVRLEPMARYACATMLDANGRPLGVSIDVQAGEHTLMVCPACAAQFRAAAAGAELDMLGKLGEMRRAR